MKTTLPADQIVVSRSWTPVRAARRLWYLTTKTGIRNTLRRIATNSLYHLKASNPGWYLYRRTHPRMLTKRERLRRDDVCAKMQRRFPSHFETRTVSRTDYDDYLRTAGYERYTAYYGIDVPGTPSFAKKTLEHYLSIKFLGFGPDDVLVDVASRDSPFADIVQRCYGSNIYKQDLVFPEGIHGNIIGGDACTMPLPDASVSRLTLHCSFEHFEGDADCRFVQEAQRVLKPGGALCIIPLYLHQTFHILTDPFVNRSGFTPDETARLVATRFLWNRQMRHYDLDHFEQRILTHCKAADWKIIYFENAGETDQSGSVNFLFLLRKPGCVDRP